MFRYLPRAGEEIIEQFYDIRHVLATYDRTIQQEDRRTKEFHDVGWEKESKIYDGYPDRFRENALQALREYGIPRNRFFHNCLGLSEDNIFILQREGTIEEVAHWLREAGAKDGIILDNGGSVFCWAWWLNAEGKHPQGGFLFTSPDFRPPSSAVVALVLKGPVLTDLPTGSVSFSAV